MSKRSPHFVQFFLESSDLGSVFFKQQLSHILYRLFYSFAPESGKA